MSAGTVKNTTLPLDPVRDSGFDLRAVNKALVAQKVPKVSLLRSRGIMCRLGGLPWNPDSNPRRRPASSHAHRSARLHFQTCAPAAEGLPSLAFVTWSPSQKGSFPGTSSTPLLSPLGQRRKTFFLFNPPPGFVSQLSKGLCSKYESTATDSGASKQPGSF